MKQKYREGCKPREIYLAAQQFEQDTGFTERRHANPKPFTVFNVLRLEYWINLVVDMGTPLDVTRAYKTPHHR